MKRLLSIALLITLLITLLPTNTYAAANLEADTSIIYLDDGSYITVELTWADTRATNTKQPPKLIPIMQATAMSSGALFSGVLLPTQEPRLPAPPPAAM